MDGKARYTPVIDFWIPTNKTGLLNYLLKQFPFDTKKLLAMKKNRLMAIYINTRKKKG